MIWLFVIAGACELVGLALAGVGFRQTWVANGGVGSLTKAAVVGLGNATTIGLRRIGIRIPRKKVVASTGTFAGQTSRVEGHAAGLMPVPDPADDPAEFLRQLREQLAELHGKSYENEWAIKRESDARVSAVQDLRAEIASKSDQIERQTKSVARDGLPLQAWGWFLVMVGVALNTVGQIWQVCQS